MNFAALRRLAALALLALVAGCGRERATSSVSVFTVVCMADSALPLKSAIVSIV